MSRYIDADALWMDIIHNMDYCEDILEYIEAQPTADVVERKKGKWINGKCSNCGSTLLLECIETEYEISDMEKLMNFCPNCGSDNREE